MRLFYSDNEIITVFDNLYCHWLIQNSRLFISLLDSVHKDELHANEHINI